MTSRDDPPPPPYTETDVYSASGDQRSRTGASQQANSHGSGDAASVPPSAASSSGDVIYTPPLTPRSSHQSNQSNFANDVDHLSTSSAAAYFDSRPALRPFHSEPWLIHSVTVRHDSSPDDFPCPSAWAGRDVRPEDWQTFINYLIPHYSAENNSHIIDRKLRAESSQPNDSTHAEAQLNQIRSPAESAQRRQNVEDTVREWNDGFFGERGITIRLNPVADEPHVPGAWDRSFDQAADTAEPNDSRNIGRQDPATGTENAAGNFRFGGITVDGDRLAIGNNFVADRNGLRIGGLVADNNGISRGGVPLFSGEGRRNSRFSGNPRCQPTGPFGMGHGRHPWGPGAGGSCDGRGGWGRGRSLHSEGKERLSRSRSSSSSSSSSSATSVGSLPDYDDLRDTQLPLAKHYLQRWLNDPDQPITKASVKRVKEEIKAAKKNPANAPGGINDVANLGADKAALRREVKGLIKEWKALKKQQRSQARQLKRERREAKRAAKRERRNVRRDMRDTRRRHRRGEIPANPPNLPFGLGALWSPPAPPGVSAPPGVPGVSSPPGVPGVSSPSAPPAPPAPYAPPPGAPGGWGPHPSPFGQRGGLGGFFGRWGGPGRGPPHGFGGPSYGPYGDFPGSWPIGADETVHGASQAKFKAADDLERKIAAKETALQKVHEEIVREDEARNRGCGSGRNSGCGKSRWAGDRKTQSKAQLAAQKIELEMDALQRAMEALRVEADADFAKEIAEQDARAH